VNMLNASELRSQAARCRRLAQSISDTRTRDILKQSAEEFESEATACESGDAMEEAKHDEVPSTEL